MEANRNSHYNQRAILNNFTVKNGKSNIITLIDLKNRKIIKKDTRKAYAAKGLYPNDLESMLNEKIEQPCLRIFKHIAGSKREVSLYRKELELLQKYLLIQRYRSPWNLKTYSPVWNGDVLGINRSMFGSDEESLEYVFGEMREILNKDWDDLIESDNREIADNVILTKTTSTMIVRTDSEFVVNDHLTATERHNSKHSGSMNAQMMKMLENVIRDCGCTADGESIDRYISGHQWVDNYQVFPIAPNTAIILVDGVWTRFFRGQIDRSVVESLGYRSPFLEKNYKLCKNDYVNKNFICEPIARYGLSEETVRETNDCIEKCKDPNDRFIYPIITLDDQDKDWLNCLLINEATEYIGFRTLEGAMPSIMSYNGALLERKNDLSWVQEMTDRGGSSE